MRTYLAPGTVIPVTGEGATRQVYIEQVIGEGASCIVYDGFFVDVPGVKERCRLKECYPLDAKIVRQGNRLVWSDLAERLSAQKRFQSVRQISFDMRYNPEVGNQITKSGYYENGDNFYLIMDINHGQTLDKENTKDINRILKIVLKLTQLVGKLHNLGCRYLDLKPDNILVSNDPDPDIWLFDFDSLVPVDNSNTISYSKGWAAPELVQGKFSSLCNATDLYSIGAILFHKIMGRFVTNDDIGLFADWDFDGETFDNLNPKVHRCLREIFKRTLSASVKRRYQSAAELIDTLTSASEAAAAKNYIVTPDLQIPSHFIGREREINEIHKSFQNSNKAVFLHGVGGIGKSSLAIAYAINYKKDYDNILFCRYKTSLEDLLIDLVDEIQNFEGDTKEGLRQLKRLLDKDTLLIVDNFDVATDEDPYLHQFLKLNAKLLFTSRTDFRNQLSQNSIQLEVSTLPYNQLESLFSNISGIQVNTADKQQCLSKLLESIDYHTYVTELLARQIISSGWSLEVLARKIENGLNGLAFAEKVQATKDDLSPKQTIPEGLRVLFKLASLNDQSKQVLRNMYLLDQFTAVDKDTYKLFCASKWYEGETRDENGGLKWYHFHPYISESSPEVDVINELCELGWVQNWYTLYSLHPLVSELVRHDLKPCQDNCHRFYEYINATLLSYMYPSVFDEADERELRDHFELLLDFLTHIDLDDQTNRKIAFGFLSTTVDSEYGWIVEPECEIVMENLLSSVIKLEDDPQTIFDAYLLQFKVHVQTYASYHEKEKWSSHIWEDYTQLQHSVEKLAPETKPKANARVYEEIRLMVQNHLLPNKFIQHAYELWPEMFIGFDTVDKEMYGLPVSDSEWVAFREKTKYIFGGSPNSCQSDSCENEDSDDVDEAWENHINEVYGQFCIADDKLAFAQQLYKESDLAIYQVVAFLLEFCERFFDKISFCHSYKDDDLIAFVNQTDWVGINATLDFAEELQASKSWEKEFDGYSLYDDAFCTHSETGEPYRSSICDTLSWRAKLDIIAGDWVALENKITQGFPHRYSGFPSHWYTLPIWRCANICWNLGKCYHIVPILLNWLAEEEKSSFDEREHISLFERIVDYSQKAAEEVNTDEKQAEEFSKIANDFINRINRITGKQYTLKRESKNN